MRIVELAEVPHLGPVLARWHANEWGHLYDPGVWDEAAAIREFEEQDVAGRVPTTYVALDEHGDPLGSVTLAATDDLAGYEHLTPWLASLYVVPEARGRGLGSALAEHLVSEARRMGFAAVHLFTPDHAAWYAQRGWAVLALESSGDHPVTVMRRALA